MLRLTANPDSLFFRNKWSLYAHIQSVSSTFSTSFVKIADIYTIADFWKVFNNIPSCDDLYSNLIYLNDKRIIAYSFFKDDITPEWEHPVNMKGCEWGCREEMSSDVFTSLFNELVLLVVNDDIANIVGIRCINKCNKQRNIYKIEIWMQSNDITHANLVRSYIDSEIKYCKTSMFTLLFHEDKQVRASEYSILKKKNKTYKRIKF